MNLSLATHYAEKCRDWLAPYCELIEIAGSVRRRRPVCNDVDLVVIPKFEFQRDMFGVTIARQNRCARFIAEYLAATPEAKLLSGQAPDPDIMSIQLPKVQLDLFFADTFTWVTRLVCRTGSARHNIKIIAAAKSQGMRWNPSQGLFKSESLLSIDTEHEFFARLGLPYVEPEHREIP